MTAFLTRYDLFEYCVVPFGSINAPATFQRYLNHVLHQFLDRFCTAYLDDILIYSDTEEEHVNHVSQVLQALEDANLFLDIMQCEFHVREVKYLGLIVSTDGIRMDMEKVEAVLAWPRPNNLKDVEKFLGFCNFYLRFISSYSFKAQPLTALTSAAADLRYPWKLDSPEEKAFQDLKQAFATAGSLAHFDSEKETFVETDA